MTDTIPRDNTNRQVLVITHHKACFLSKWTSLQLNTVYDISHKIYMFYQHRVMPVHSQRFETWVPVNLLGWLEHSCRYKNDTLIVKQHLIGYAFLSLSLKCFTLYVYLMPHVNEKRCVRGGRSRARCRGVVVHVCLPIEGCTWNGLTWETKFTRLLIEEMVRGMVQSSFPPASSFPFIFVFFTDRLRGTYPPPPGSYATVMVEVNW